MKIRQLEYFITIADEGGFNRAASRLHVAQPSLSVQIKALEDEIGARLFERDKRHAFLTQAGRHFQHHARNILAIAEQAKIEARCAEAGELGTLDVGYSASAMFSNVLPASVRRFRHQYPNVVLSLHDCPSLEQLNRLLERTLDLGVLRKPDVKVPAGIVISEWHHTPLVAAIQVDHPLASRTSLALDQLKNEPFIMYPREAGTGLYWQVADLCAKAGFRPRVAREVLAYSTIVGLVAAGVGVAVVPADLECIRFDGVSYVRLTDRSAFSTLYLARRAKEDNEHLGSLCEMLAENSKVHRPKKPGSSQSR